MGGAGHDELAWELLVIGHNCTFGHKGREDGTGCTRASNGDTVPFGWSLYSVEKFYTAPLAIDVKLVAEDKSGAKMALCGDADERDRGDAHAEEVRRRRLVSDARVRRVRLVQVQPAELGQVVAHARRQGNRDGGGCVQGALAAEARALQPHRHGGRLRRPVVVRAHAA